MSEYLQNIINYVNENSIQNQHTYTLCGRISHSTNVHMVNVHIKSLMHQSVCTW